MLVSELIKKEVLDARANRMGNIVDVNLDMAQGVVTYFILRTGVLKKVPLAPDKIDKVGEKIILKVSREEVEGRRVKTPI